MPRPAASFVARLLVLFLLVATAACSPPASGQVQAPRIAPDTRIDVQRYAFEIALHDTTDVIGGRATVVVEAREDDVGAFTLDLIGVDPGAGPDATGMRVTSVTDTTGRALAFTHADDRLTIDLPAALAAGAEAAVVVTYAGIPADGLIIGTNKHGDRTFFGDHWPNRARNWLPVVDHLSDKALVAWDVTAPDQYRVVAGGVLVDETDLPDGQRRTRWRTTQPIPPKVAVIGVAPFAVEDAGVAGDTPIQSWVYPQDREAGFHDFALAVPITEYFEDLLGDFPYAKLANVQSTTIFGGMENAGAIFYSEDAISGTRQNEPLLAHEIAHQWFGDAVTETDWPHLWLSEGFATYLTQVYLDHVYGRERFVQSMDGIRAAVLARGPNRPVVDTLATDLMRLLNANSYQKGAWVLHMLRQRVGDDAFFDGLRAYYARYRHGNASTRDFRAVMEEVSGDDLRAFFDQWLRRPGQPIFDGTWRYDEAEDVLVVTLRQTQRGAPFQVPLDLGLTAADGSTTLRTVDVTEREHTFRLPLSAEPEAVTLDPEVRLLFDGALRRVE